MVQELDKQQQPRAVITGEHALPEMLAKSDHFKQLVTACIKPLKDNRLQLFHDGANPYSPQWQQLETGVATLVARQCNEFFASDGSIKAEYHQQYNNVREITPQMVNIFTNQANFIRFMHEGHTLHLVDMGLALSQNPQTDVKIRVGFGGSDDPFTTERLVAYTASPLEIAQAVVTFNNNRAEQKLKQTAINKAVALWKDAQISEPEQADIKAKRKALSEDPDLVEALLSPDEQQAVKKIYGIRENPITVEFLFAQHAAKEINTTMDEGKIELRTKDNIATIQAFVHDNYRQLEKSIQYLEDIPWSEHTTYESLVLQYLAQVLRESDDPAIIKTLQTLRKTGQNHGGGNGAERADEYAGEHPLFFGDDLGIPQVENLTLAEKQPAYRVTIGGDPERHFCAARDYLVTHASADGLASYIHAQLPNMRRSSSGYKEAQQACTMLTEWQQQHQTKNPTIALITTVGTRATYYALQGAATAEEAVQNSPDTQVSWYDRPAGSPDMLTHISNLQTLQTALHNEKKKITQERSSIIKADNSDSQQERITEIDNSGRVLSELSTKLKAMLADYQILLTLQQRLAEREKQT